MVYNPATLEVRVHSNRCNVRFCPFCTRVKRAVITESVTDWLKKAAAPKLLTFTIRHTDEPLSVQVDHLYESFRLVRKRKLLKSAIRGGVWFFQLKQSGSPSTWHPHLHCLIDADYIPQSKLSALWSKVTGGSTVVDIRACKSVSATAEYVARYATSPASLLALSPADGAVALECFLDRRVVGTWGSARGVKLSVSRMTEGERWVYLELFHTVAVRSRHHDVYAIILECWQSGQPLPWDPRGVLDVDYEADEVDVESTITYRQLTFHFTNPLAWEGGT
jgi:hypothetical protein